MSFLNFCHFSIVLHVIHLLLCNIYTFVKQLVLCIFEEFVVCCTGLCLLQSVELDWTQLEGPPGHCHEQCCLKQKWDVAKFFNFSPWAKIIELDGVMLIQTEVTTQCLFKGISQLTNLRPFGRKWKLLPKQYHLEKLSTNSMLKYTCWNKFKSDVFDLTALKLPEKS